MPKKMWQKISREIIQKKKVSILNVKMKLMLLKHLLTVEWLTTIFTHVRVQILYYNIAQAEVKGQYNKATQGNTVSSPHLCFSTNTEKRIIGFRVFFFSPWHQTQNWNPFLNFSVFSLDGKQKQVVFPSDCRCLEMKTNWPRGTPSNTFSFVFSLSPISLFVVLGTHLTIYLLEMDQDFKFAHFLGCFWSQKKNESHTFFVSKFTNKKRLKLRSKSINQCQPPLPPTTVYNGNQTRKK